MIIADGFFVFYKNLLKKKIMRPRMLMTAETIQKRMVICDSGQPIASK